MPRHKYCEFVFQKADSPMIIAMREKTVIAVNV